MRSVLFTLGFVLVAQTVAAQNIFLVGQQPLTLAWSAPDTGVPGWYETRVGAGNLLNVGLVTQWTMPTLAVGNYTASVRACVADAVTQEARCGPEAAITFTLVNPTATPSAPNAPRIIPPTQVLSNQEIRQLADAFSYVHRLSGLNGNEWNYLAAQYTGPIPVTYGDEMTFLNAQLLRLFAAR